MFFGVSVTTYASRAKETGVAPKNTKCSALRHTAGAVTYTRANPATRTSPVNRLNFGTRMRSSVAALASERMEAESCHTHARTHTYARVPRQSVTCGRLHRWRCTATHTCLQQSKQGACDAGTHAAFELAGGLAHRNPHHQSQSGINGITMILNHTE